MAHPAAISTNMNQPKTTTPRCCGRVAHRRGLHLNQCHFCSHGVREGRLSKNDGMTEAGGRFTGVQVQLGVRRTDAVRRWRMEVARRTCRRAGAAGQERLTPAYRFSTRRTACSSALAYRSRSAHGCSPALDVQVQVSEHRCRCWKVQRGT